MYDPTIGRFLSMDPASPDGVDLLYDHPFAYANNNPSNLIDPSGRKAAKPPAAELTCKVALMCYRLGDNAVGPKHCGVEIEDSLGSVKYHVFTGDCSVRDDRPTTFLQKPGTLSGIAPKPEYEGSYAESVCACIRATAAKVNAEAAKGNLPYRAIPQSKCGSRPTCNSNYMAKCLLRNCGIHFVWRGINPWGWDHRMKICVKERWEDIFYGRCRACICEEWKRIDDDWCGGE